MILDAIHSHIIKESHWTAKPPPTLSSFLLQPVMGIIWREKQQQQHLGLGMQHNTHTMTTLCMGDIPKDSRQQYLLVCNIDG